MTPKPEPALPAPPDRSIMRILIVEDDKITRLVLRRILETIGDLELSEAEDGLLAWEMLERGLTPDFCFLDINTPRLNGLELLKRIRRDHRLARLKVCFCSVVRDRETITRAAVLQPDYYLLKPYTREAIADQVNRARTALNLRHRADSVEAINERVAKILPTLRELRAELESLERMAQLLSKPQAPIPKKVEAIPPNLRTEMDELARLLTDVVKRGFLLPWGKTPATNPSSAKEQPAPPPESSEKTGEAQTSKMFFSRTTLAEETAADLERCRNTDDLMETLGLPFGEGERWFSREAGDLLEREIASRNDQGRTLLRSAIGTDLQAFLRKQEAIIRQNVTDGTVQEAQVQEMLQEVRQRLEPVWEGNLIAKPFFTKPELGDLIGVCEDAPWTAPYDVLYSAALLFRDGTSDAEPERGVGFKSFDHQAFIEALDVFGDTLAKQPDPARADREKQQLETIATSPASTAEKCLMIWTLMKELPCESPKTES